MFVSLCTAVGTTMPRVVLQGSEQTDGRGKDAVRVNPYAVEWILYMSCLLEQAPRPYVGWCVKQLFFCFDLAVFCGVASSFLCVCLCSVPASSLNLRRANARCVCTHSLSVITCIKAGTAAQGAFIMWRSDAQSW